MQEFNYTLQVMKGVPFSMGSTWKGYKNFCQKWCINGLGFGPWGWASLYKTMLRTPFPPPPPPQPPSTRIQCPAHSWAIVPPWLALQNKFIIGLSLTAGKFSQSVVKAMYLDSFINLSSSSVVHWQRFILTSTDNEPVINRQTQHWFTVVFQPGDSIAT